VTDKGSKIFKIVSKPACGVVWANTYNKFDPSSRISVTKKAGLPEGGRHGLLICNSISLVGPRIIRSIARSEIASVFKTLGSYLSIHHLASGSFGSASKLNTTNAMRSILKNCCKRPSAKF